MMINVSDLETGNIDFENHGYLTFFGNSNADLIINGLEGMLDIPWVTLTILLLVLTKEFESIQSDDFIIN